MGRTSGDTKDADHRSDDAPPAERGAAGAADPVIPPDVRAQLLELAARVLGTWEPATVPVSLRRVRTFAPRRRAVAGAVPLWTALETSPRFRHAVAASWSLAHPEVAQELVPDVAPADKDTHGADAPPSSGGGTSDPGPVADEPDEGETAPSEPSAQGDAHVRDGSDVVGQEARAHRRPDAGPGRTLDLAVGAYLLRPDGWEQHLERAHRDAETREARKQQALEVEQAVAERDRAVAELDALKQAAAADRAALDEARAEIATLRRAERRLRSDADRARAEGRAARAEAETRTADAEALAARAAAERREAAVALERAQAARDEARTLTHTGAELANARARLLLETVVDAAVGLRRELGLPPTTLRPGDTVTPAASATSTATAAARTRPGSRGRTGDDPALLDDVLAIPQMHLIVDGYNVTKTGFGSLTLAQQRRRLVDGLVRIASRTGAEVTCCFDGQDLGHLPPASTRGIRVLFTSGEIADHLIRRLVAAEPEGRPVAVVSSDREVADDVQAMGAVAIGSPALVARLARL